MSEKKTREGEARGVVFKTDAQFVRRRAGEEEVRKVEARLAELGSSLRYETVEAMEFYPFRERILSLKAVRDVLGLSRAEVVEMGRVAPKTSLLVKMFSRFFFSIERTLEHAPEMWSKHYTTGRLEAALVEEDRMVIELKEVSFEPVFLAYLEGYLATVVEMVVNAKVKETSLKEKEQGYMFVYEW